MTAPVVIGGFGGPGGWSTGLRWAGWIGRCVEVEINTAACATASAAGHERVHGDVLETNPRELANGAPVVGGMWSPPCGPFSSSGDGDGRRELDRVCERITAYAAGRTPPVRDWLDDRTALCAEPMRWIAAVRPRWVVLEQVPAVLPVWQHCAALLRQQGYYAWTGKLDAEAYGVPQARDRALLIADLDAPAGPPNPTHQSYRPGRPPQVDPDMFGDALPPPVTMADALGWGLPDRPSWTVSGGGTSSGGAEVFANAECRRQLAVVTATQWAATRPSTTVCGDPRIAPPGHKDRAGGERQFGEGTIRITPAEAGVLQSFPADYPWQGTKTQQHQQVGDAVPPLLARAILAPRLAVPRRFS